MAPDSESTRTQALEEEVERLKARIKELERREHLRKHRRWKIFDQLRLLSLRTIAGPRLYEATRKGWNQWSKYIRGDRDGPWPEDATRDFTASLLDRLLRSTTWLLLLSLIPLAVLMVQTWTLARQTTHLGDQNEVLRSQTRILNAQLQATQTPVLTLQPKLLAEQNSFAIEIRNPGIVDMRCMDLRVIIFDVAQENLMSADDLEVLTEWGRPLPSVLLKSGTEITVSVDQATAILSHKKEYRTLLATAEVTCRREVGGDNTSFKQAYILNSSNDFQDLRRLINEEFFYIGDTIYRRLMGYGEDFYMSPVSDSTGTDARLRRRGGRALGVLLAFR